MSDKQDSERRFPTVTSVWSENIEKVIKTIGESCEGYKWMNIFAAKKASTRHNILMYALIFIGPISGVLSTVLSVNQEDGSATLQILVIIFSFLSGVISAIIKFSKYEQKTTSYKSIAAKYASLEGNVRRQLSLYRSERVNAGDYLDWVSTSFDDLFSSTPLIPEDIYKKWVEFAKTNGLEIPKRLGQTIQIADEEHITHLSNVGEIGVNTGSARDRAMTAPNPATDTFEVVVQGSGTIQKNKRKRSIMYNSTAELNRYTDSAMQYELRRLYNYD
uniref:VP11 n=1 Tax=viral metagenome TaxID=1070528 RepID=A0A6C0EJZ2_9ZZZZ